jgi:hypothetical protein
MHQVEAEAQLLRTLCRLHTGRMHMRHAQRIRRLARAGRVGGDVRAGRATPARSGGVGWATPARTGRAALEVAARNCRRSEGYSTQRHQGKRYVAIAHLGPAPRPKWAPEGPKRESLVVEDGYQLKDEASGSGPVVERPCWVTAGPGSQGRPERMKRLVRVPLGRRSWVHFLLTFTVGRAKREGRSREGRRQPIRRRIRSELVVRG